MSEKTTRRVRLRLERSEETGGGGGGAASRSFFVSFEPLLLVLLLSSLCLEGSDAAAAAAAAAAVSSSAHRLPRAPAVGVKKRRKQFFLLFPLLSPQKHSTSKHSKFEKKKKYRWRPRHLQKHQRGLRRPPRPGEAPHLRRVRRGRDQGGHGLGRPRRRHG